MPSVERPRSYKPLIKDVFIEGNFAVKKDPGSFYHPYGVPFHLVKQIDFYNIILPLFYKNV